MIAVPIWLATLLATLFVTALGALVSVTWRLSRAAALLDEAIRRLDAIEERVEHRDGKLSALEVGLASLAARVDALQREHDREPTGRHATVQTPPLPPRTT